MKSVLPIALMSIALLTGCAAQTVAADDEPTARVSTPSATPTPTPVVTVAPVTPAVPAPPPPAPVTAPAPAYIDYVTPVTNRWGGCFSRLGVGDIYYDSVTSTVTGGWNGGSLVWAVGPGNASGTPADQASMDALAGC